MQSLSILPHSQDSKRTNKNEEFPEIKNKKAGDTVKERSARLLALLCLQIAADQRCCLGRRRGPAGLDLFVVLLLPPPVRAAVAWYATRNMRTTTDRYHAATWNVQCGGHEGEGGVGSMKISTRRRHRAGPLSALTCAQMYSGSSFISSHVYPA